VKPHHAQRDREQHPAGRVGVPADITNRQGGSVSRGKYGFHDRPEHHYRRTVKMIDEK
jgi:hypothetical protein